MPYAVQPIDVEFWQGARDRRHRRPRYQRVDDG
nr:pyridoxine 5'-phosphate oxidase C-terminal domain-containing protein [Mycobacterium sp. OTB74]